MYISESCVPLFFLSAFLTVKIVSCSFTREWAVEIDGDEVAKQVAEKHDFEYLGKIFHNVHHFQQRRLSKRSLKPSHYHHRKLRAESHVKWVEQQVIKKRVKRDFFSSSQTNQSSPHEHEVMMNFNDAKWPEMWYLNRGNSLDMNVQRVWASGITGKGVVVTILDDGIERTHPDLVKNYNPKASLDINGNDPDPMPRYDYTNMNRHGTRCAGEVAADANNSICAVGVAYEASIGGIRMLDGEITDIVEAKSLSLRPNHIDIYVAAWGPDDDGKTLDGPNTLATRAFKVGVTYGRGGKGSIFVWSSGNGGRFKDDCNCDGYTTAIWTISVSSVTENGQVPWYGEACSSILASTYSSGSNGEGQIITTDLRKSCTSHHTGTSASAPLAAGICALALQANYNLTWRDMQHLVVRTARSDNLHAPDWQINGVGRKFSHRFGYGLMDAYEMVEMARNWTTVPRQKKCAVFYIYKEEENVTSPNASIMMNVTDCFDVNFLEHVQAKISLTGISRRNIEIYLISPAGTKSKLLAKRPHDRSTEGFNVWPFMTVHMWGESPSGLWKLEVYVEDKLIDPRYNTNFRKFKLILYGTTTQPEEPETVSGQSGQPPQVNNDEAITEEESGLSSPNSEKVSTAIQNSTSIFDANTTQPVETKTVSVHPSQGNGNKTSDEEENDLSSPENASVSTAIQNSTSSSHDNTTQPVETKTLSVHPSQENGNKTSDEEENDISSPDNESISRAIQNSTLSSYTNTTQPGEPKTVGVHPSQGNSNKTSDVKENDLSSPGNERESRTLFESARSMFNRLSNFASLLFDAHT